MIVQAAPSARTATESGHPAPTSVVSPRAVETRAVPPSDSTSAAQAPARAASEPDRRAGVLAARRFPAAA